MTVAPTVSFIIPTLNSEAYLEGCLAAIQRQHYPAEQVEILVCDGGSTDATRDIATRADARVVANPGRTGEAGKAAGIRTATGEILAFIDSDNEIVGDDWLRRMVAPFADPTIVSSEVLRWQYVREDGIVNRYCALTGINDPTSLFVGNYGRFSWLTRRWTDYPVTSAARADYLEVLLDPARVPTMGANGYLVRAEVLRTIPGVDRFLFDIDAVAELAIRAIAGSPASMPRSVTSSLVTRGTLRARPGAEHRTTSTTAASATAAIGGNSAASHGSPSRRCWSSPFSCRLPAVSAIVPISRGCTTRWPAGSRSPSTRKR